MRPYGEFEGRFVGADAHIGPLGIDANGTPAERSYSYNRNQIWKRRNYNGIYSAWNRI